MELTFLRMGFATMANGRKVGEVGMKDPYEKAWESIGKALSTQSKMVLWIAERTLSAKDFKEFVDEFSKKSEDNRDELIDFLHKEDR